VLHQRNTDWSQKSGWFANFPSHAIHNRDIEEAVLCYLMGKEPLAYLLSLIRYLTDGKMRTTLGVTRANTK
jgi:hypothetical protein